MELEKVIKERYSVRTFKDIKIEKEKIEELLKVLNYVPTACNLQPEKVYVLESKESLEKISKVSNTYQAPLVLLITSDLNIAWKNPKEDYNTTEMDGSIAATYLMLKAWDMGIGSVWIRYFNSDEIKEIFSLEENIKPICLLALGYRQDESQPSPRHFEKKELKELIEYI